MFILYDKSGKVWSVSQLPWRETDYKSDILTMKEVAFRYVMKDEEGEILNTVDEFDDFHDEIADLRSKIEKLESDVGNLKRR